MHYKIQIGDTVYELDPAFCEGMKAAQENMPYGHNPYKETHKDNNYQQWNDGHENQCNLIMGMIE